MKEEFIKRCAADSAENEILVEGVGLVKDLQHLR